MDFTAEVERSLRVLDGAVAVFCSVAGVQPQSETVWRQMDKYHVPRLAYINKMDRTGADFLGAVRDIREKLGGNAHPLFLNIGAEDQFKGLIDLLENKAYLYDDTDPKGMKFDVTDIPAEYKAEAEKCRSELVDRRTACRHSKSDAGFEIYRRYPRQFLQKQRYSDASGCHCGLFAESAGFAADAR